ncbi:MAG: tRNA preQ1(34) S-adenosylmethionine ribosyltransferase-isomerase QueA [Spirochaetaceae bacterium]|nr:tRNA preQ1(34) S-adenosylmethionine ribosyltransferase-isomerase QueA [Spirochaetaceae bacterium]
MLTEDFNFDLDEKFIAQKPSERRGDDKLMVLDRETGKIIHSSMEKICDFIPENALMVFNNSKVRAARVFAREENSETPREFLFINPLRDGTDATLWQVMTRNARRQKPGKQFVFDDGLCGEIAEWPDFDGTEFRVLRFNSQIDEGWFEKNGHIPLPPYIRRSDEDGDFLRYQTIFAEKIGSIAAPTAGLHFTRETLAALEKKGVEQAFVTLHVGLGTFLPVRAEKIEEHKMHRESFFVSEDVATAVERAVAENRPIVAVGTTSVRSLESAWKNGKMSRGWQSTDIFIYPGYEFKVVNKLFTNFHTPKSTLLMLVSAFAGKEKILAAYEEAKKLEYRFFSYGDAMIIS